MEIKTNIDVEKILTKRGLGKSKAAVKLMAQTVARLSDPYVPMSAGAGAHMKTCVIAGDGSTITYRGPYAKYQFKGVVMVGSVTGSPWAKKGEPKVTTGRALQYHGAPMRGKEWVNRMMADRGEEVVQAVAKKVGGKKK